MIQKIKLWLNKFRKKSPIALTQEDMKAGSYTYEQLQNSYLLGYNDGKRDGLSIAREQATKSLKEILQWQNNQSQK